MSASNRLQLQAADYTVYVHFRKRHHWAVGQPQLKGICTIKVVAEWMTIKSQKYFNI